MKSSSGLKYLVTGGAGFIGSNLAERLVADGHKVIVLDNISSGSLNNLRNVKEKISFIKSPVMEVLEKKEINGLSGIFHFGIPSSSPMYKQNPYLVGEAINEFISILELAKREKCKLVYASSSSLYNGNPTPYREDMPIFVKDLYTEARYAIERLAKLYSDWYKVSSIGLRFFSAYGPHEEAKKNFANLITQFLWAVKKGKNPVIYGDGNQTRDFTYVKDIVEGASLAMGSSLEHDIFNLGSGERYTLNEMVSALGKSLGKKIKCDYVANNLLGYVYETEADTSKAEKILGFKAKYNLEMGIKEIIECYNYEASEV